MRRDLVVLSHLRWTWVWQRPQQLVSRLASQGWRVTFVEEPLPGAAGVSPAHQADVDTARLRVEEQASVRRVWLDVPPPERHVDLDDPAAGGYGEALRGLLGSHRPAVVWLYTPLGLPLARDLDPELLVYDVMDDLASFAGAVPHLRQRQLAALDAADVVFTGGRTLHRGVTSHRRENVWLFPSGVDVTHYAAAATRPRGAGRPVAGYVGVIDERLDLDLLEGLAALLPDWEVRVVGPVAKIDPSTLPVAENLHFTGPRTYDQLPSEMAAFDVAIMPFALNEATRSISPTKTLEYLAAGLPVVSTPVADVVTDFGDVVEIAKDADGFAEACIQLRGAAPAPRTAALLERLSWDRLASQMAEIVETALAGRNTQEKSA